MDILQSVCKWQSGHVHSYAGSAHVWPISDFEGQIEEIGELEKEEWFKMLERVSEGIVQMSSTFLLLDRVFVLNEKKNEIFYQNRMEYFIKKYRVIKRTNCYYKNLKSQNLY